MKQTFAPHRHKVLADFVTAHDAQLAETADILGRYIDNLDDHRLSGRGLTLLGPNGVGKTMLGNVVLNEAAKRGYRIEAIEMFTYVGLHKDLFTLQALLKAGEDVGEQVLAARQHLRYIEGVSKHSADWVLFDDVGREYASDSGWSQQQLFDVVRTRFDRNRPTLITSNLPIKHLDERYGEGLSSFLQEATEMVVVDGEDYRWKKES